MADQIIIELIGDASQLTPAVDILEQLGQIDQQAANSFRKSNAELQQRAQITKQIVAEEQKQIATLKDVEKAVDQLTSSFIDGFQEGVTDALKEAGVSFDQFEDALKNAGEGLETTTEKQKSFRTEIRETREALAQQLAQGKLTTAQLYEMAAGAGGLRDALGDANQAINVLSSDTFGLDAAVGSFQLLANGAQIAMGATALLGEENEDLQRILVKLNAVMAITQGLQSVVNLLQKNSVVTLGAQVLWTKAQTAAQTAYNFVTNAGTVATKAFRAALLATGIGAVIAIIATLIQKMVDLRSATDDATNSFEAMQHRMEQVRNETQRLIENIDSQTALELARLRSIGATDLQIFEAQRKALIERRKLLREESTAINTEIGRIFPSIQRDKQAAEEYKKLQDQLLENEKAYDENERQLLLLQYQFKEQQLKKQERAEKSSAQKIASQVFQIRKLRFDEEIRQADQYFNEIFERTVDAAEALQKEINSGFSGISLLNAQELDQDLDRVKQLYDQGLIDLQTYEQRRSEIIEEYRVRELRNEKARLEALIQGLKAKNVDVTDLEKQLFRVKEELRNADLDKHKRNEADKTRSTKEETEKRKQANLEAARAAFEVARAASDAIFSVQQANRQRNLDEELRKLQQQRDFELNNENLTQRQKEIIAERFARKEAELKRRAFIADQNAKARQALINGFLAATQALATMPPPFSFIAASAAIVSAGIQATAIRSTPVPAFKKGTKRAPKGFAWVGEEGPELVQLAGGERIWTYSQSKKVEAGWNKGMMYQPDQIISGMIPSVDEEVISNSYVTSSGQLQLDYDAMGKAVAKYMPEPKQVNNIMDEDGITTFFVEKNQRTQIKNKRYKL